MGYDTSFDGTLTVTPPLNDHEVNFLDDFVNTRHTSHEHGPLDLNAGSQARGNDPQYGKPGIWCHWVGTDEGNLTWDGGEKTYDHDQWLVWLIENLLGPQSKEFVKAHLDEDYRLEHFTSDHILNGYVNAHGESSDDLWRIKVVDNVVETQTGRVVYE